MRLILIISPKRLTNIFRGASLRIAPPIDFLPNPIQSLPSTCRLTVRHPSQTAFFFNIYCLFFFYRLFGDNSHPIFRPFGTSIVWWKRQRQNQMGSLFPTLWHKSFVHSRLIDILLLSTLFGTNSFFTCIWYQIWSFIIPILFADPLAQVLCPLASDRCLEAEIEAEDWDAPLPRSYLSGSTKSPSWVTGVF